MNELVREIEEDIRRERIDKLWHSFGKMMVGVSIAVILATIGVVIVQDRKFSRETEKTAEMIKGIDRMNIEDYKGAIQIFDGLAKDESSPYYGMAMLRKAQAQIALGAGDDAKKTYGQLAKHDEAFGPIGKVLSYGGIVNAGDVIEAPQKNSALYFTQSEFRAWQLLQNGQKKEAVEAFLAIFMNTGAPGSMHDRMFEVLQHIAPETLTKNTIEPAQPLTKPAAKDATHE